MATQCVGLSSIALKTISSLHSNASARQIINDNFEQIQAAMECIKSLDFSDLTGIVFPNPPQNGVQYVLEWNGTNYVLIQTDFNPGTKFVIELLDDITIGVDYQYIVYQGITILGAFTVLGELVILN